MSARVASNTAIGLVEVVVTALVSVFHLRLILRVLGTVDYGIFTALGASGLVASVVIFGFRSAALRYLGLAAGSNDRALRRSTMASTVGLYLGLAAVIVLLGVVFRSLVLDTLTIPADRFGAAGTVYCRPISASGFCRWWTSGSD